jgi:hypothetical protein
MNVIPGNGLFSALGSIVGNIEIEKERFCRFEYDFIRQRFAFLHNNIEYITWKQ